MPALGPRALMDIAGLTGVTGVDARSVLQFQMEDGVSAEQVVADAVVAVGTVNQRLIERYGGLLFLTDRDHAYYRQGEGSRSMTPKRAEFAEADAVRGQIIGHMLPREDYFDAVAWTELFLRRGNRILTDIDIRLISERWEDRVDFDVILRLLSMAENAIGASGYDVPWAIGSGANANYIPPNYRGNAFDSTHTHFEYVDSSGDDDHSTLIENMVKELRHHGHARRLTCIVSETDAGSYAALSRFVEITNFKLMAGASDLRSAEGELEGVPGEVFGYYQTEAHGVVELRHHERFPTGYAFMTKSYGVNDPRNGLAVREEPGVGFGMQVKPKMSDDMVRKLDRIVFEATHGVGVNDRTNGVAGYIASGASEYVEPTIE